MIILQNVFCKSKKTNDEIICFQITFCKIYFSILTLFIYIYDGMTGICKSNYHGITTQDVHHN